MSDLTNICSSQLQCDVEAVFESAEVVEAFIHLHGRHQWFREIFEASAVEEAMDYVDIMLDHKFAGTTPEGTWSQTPQGDGVFIWPGQGKPNPPSTKGYVVARDIQTDAATALELQDTNPQIFRL